MRNSLKKLRGLTQRKADCRDNKKERRQQSAPQLDELARATQDMIDMRDCYDSLLSAAAATTNSAYEFSESLKELGACLLEKTALNDDEESGSVLLKLGKLQFEIQKLIDNYRSHIFKTITKPAESLLNELRVVEDMKKQCDDKRKLYEEMIPKHREKGRLRGNKGESVSSQQLQAAHDNYDEEATLFVFRLKSLKQGQSRSLLTQAARHHAAQLCFFRKALHSLETVEPLVKLVTEHHHIDYHFSGLEDDDVDSGDNDESDFSESESSSYDGDGELSFDYGQDDQGRNVVSTQRVSMEIDQPDLTFPQVVTADAVKEHAYRNPSGDFFLSSKGVKTISQSAPLTAESKFDPADRIRQMQPLLSSRKYHTYVLPTPIEPKRPVSPVLDAQTSQTRRASVSGATFNYRHSSPFLEPRRHETITRNEYLSGPILSSQSPVLRESNNNNSSVPLLRPLAEEISPRYTSDTKKIKRHAFSGPLTGKTPSIKTGGLSSNNPMVSTAGLPKMFSGPLLRTPVPRSSPKVSPSTSPPFVSSPQISELHELPRPPPKPSAVLVGWPSNEVGYSGPLVTRGQEVTATNQVGYSGPLVTRGQALNQAVNVAASPLPVPPAVPRSHSIPSSGQRGSSAPYAPTPLGAPRVLKTGEDIASPPLTPISLPLIQPAPDVS